MSILHLLTALATLQHTSATGTSSQTRPAPSARAKSTAADSARADSMAGAQAILPPATPAQIASAYADADARTLITRARRARDIQDSSILAYDANTVQRISAGIGFTALGRDRLAFRYESSSHIRWARGVGAAVEITGRRSATPIFGLDSAEGDQPGNANLVLDVEGADIDQWESPVPYFPGRDALWVGSAVARAQGSTEDLIHPLVNGAEAYYVYRTGDSVTIRLQDSTTIRLREVEVRPRMSAWNVIVGTLWFDVATGQLVRAAYKLAEPLDLGLGSATITGFAVEYGLHDEKYWLPRSQSAQGNIQVGFVRLPIEIKEEFTYNAVNVADATVTIPAQPLRPPLDTSTLAGLADAERMSRKALLNHVRDSLAAAERTAECKATGSWVDRVARYDSTLVVAIQVPCDPRTLAMSSTLPGSIFDQNDRLFGDADAEALLAKVAAMLPLPGWAFSAPSLDWGFDLERFNRVEGLSSAMLIDQSIGGGVSAHAEPRFGFGDHVFNGELSITTEKPFALSVAGYRRLAAANDWGDPLNVGSSLSAILFGRDEGFYYRAAGVELGGERPGGPRHGLRIRWRLFDEQQLDAPTRTNWSLPELLGGSGFIPEPNIAANPTRESGASLRVTGSTGLDPHGWRTLTDVRLEGAAGGFDYGRAAADLTLSHDLFAAFDGALTLSGGTSAGTVPTQRLWYLGGTATVRGESPGTMAGDSYWLTRLEIGDGSTGARAVVFGDIGWAGNRDSVRQVGRPMSGVGLGFSFLDGLLRLDVARGLVPVAQWRVSLYLDGKL